ncbi:MAG: hypothetical protein U0T75_03745 [Chitinophagales bacterium]
MRDSHGCIDTKSTVITQPTLLTLAVDSTGTLLVSGSSTGGVFVTAGGGTTPYTFAWSNGATSEDNINLPIGTYTVTVTDNKGYAATGSSVVTQPTLLVPSIAAFHNLNCYHDSTGWIDLSVSGSVAPYTLICGVMEKQQEDISNLTRLQELMQ